MSQTLYAPDMDQQKVLSVNAELERWLRDRVGIPTWAEPLKPPSQAVISAVQGLLSFGQEPDDPYPMLSRGDPLSTISRLPRPWANCLFQCLLGVPPYTAFQARIEFMSRLVNTGQEPIEIIVGVRTDYLLDPSTNAQTDEWNKEPILKTLEPGKTVEVDPERANLILWRHGIAAHRPGERSKGGYKAEAMGIREIGYRASWRPASDSQAQVDSQEWQAKQAEAAFVSAKELLAAGKSDDARTRLAFIQPWWPRQRGLEALSKELAKGL